MQTKDDEIIELYWKRDPKAIEETQTHYGEKLGRLSFGILENREDAQECVNDTYLRTWNSIPPTRPQFLFAYLAKICRFLCFVNVDAANVSESITPREYADLLFDGIGAALVFNFKRLKREELDGLKPKIDWSMVESFPFPASFEEQQYIGDEGKIHVYSWDGRQETDLVGPYSVRDLYLDHFGKL